MEKNKNVSRRQFLKIAGMFAGGAALAACTTPTAQIIKETQIVKETSVSVVKETSLVKETSIVKQTSIVEVTPTTPPLLKTIQGRELPADAAPLEKQLDPTGFAEPKFLDPARDIYSAGFSTNFLTEPMLRNNENFELVPAAFESWKPGPKAAYWEFVIREGSVWSDGKPITADDVVYTFKHLSNPDISGGWGPGFFFQAVKGVYKAFTKAGTMDEIGVIKIDDRTVQIQAEYAGIPQLPYLLSYQSSVIVPKHVAEANPAGWANNAEGYVGNGPYILTKWDHNLSGTMELSPTYNGPHKPAITKIDMAPGSAVGLVAWMDGEYNLMTGLGLPDVSAIRASTKYNPMLHFFNNFQSEYITFNTNMAPLDNKDVRMALAKSIDRDTMCFQVMNGTYLPGYTLLPPSFPGYNAELKAVQMFDVEAAKALLVKAGVTDPAKIKIDLYVGGRDPRMEFIKQQWETNLGITVDLKLVEGSVWGDMRGKHTMMAYKGPYEYDYLDPSNFLTSLFRSVPAPEGQKEPWGSPRHAWKNDQFDKLVTDADSVADAAERIKMFQDAERLLVEDAGAAFITHQVIFQVWHPWLVGIPTDNTGNKVFRYLDITRFQMYIHKDVDEMKKA